MDQQFVKLAANFTEMQNDANSIKTSFNMVVKKIDLQEAEIANIKNPFPSRFSRHNSSIDGLFSETNLKIQELEHMLETSPSSKFRMTCICASFKN